MGNCHVSFGNNFLCLNFLSFDLGLGHSFSSGTMVMTYTVDTASGINDDMGISGCSNNGDHEGL